MPKRVRLSKDGIAVVSPDGHVSIRVGKTTPGAFEKRQSVVGMIKKRRRKKPPR